MAAASYALVLFLCLRSGPVQAEVQKPQNLTMATLNTQYNLKWSWHRQDQPDATGRHTVTFTVQYLPKYMESFLKPVWTTVCERTPHTHCDLTPSNLYFHGIYVIRVCAKAGGLHSEWAKEDFCPDKDAALGPPSQVVLARAGALLDVVISDPLTSTNGSMREMHNKMYFRIRYWERSRDAKTLHPHVLDTDVNLVTLPDLQAWTSYCVSVQSRFDFYNKSSSFTAPHCMQIEGATPWWQIVLYFLLSLVLGFVVVLLPLYLFFRCYRTLKSSFYPSIQLPAHIQEYLCDSSPGSDVPRLLTPDSEAELVFDKVSVCPEAVLLEIHTPPSAAVPAAPPSGLEPDCRHSRQGSGGSGDSGVYSTEGGSSQKLLPSSAQSSAGTGEPWRDPVSTSTQEQLKMGDMGPKWRAGMLDEGVGDVCV